MASIVYVDKSIKKSSNNQMIMMDKGLQKLLRRIRQYESDGISFERIVNDDTVKYDILGNGFYTYKIQTTQMPLRILYRFVRTKSDFVIEVHQVYQKHKGKEYIKNFENYALCH